VKTRSLLVLIAVTGTASLATAQTPSGPTGSVRYYHVDAIGSIRAVTDSQGAVVARHDYFSFGEDPTNTPNPAPQRFAGKEHDSESVMDYSGARYYMPWVGRFTTSDPNHVNGQVSDPQSWNAYAYARNNPLRFIDPTGTDYLVSVDGGQSFWASDREFELLRGNPGAGISLLGGLVLAGGRIVGTYEYYSPFDRVLVDAGRRAEPGVNAALALGAATTAVPAAAIGTGAVVAGGGTTVVLGGMGGSIAGAISQISNPRVRDALSALYQATDRFRGGTAAAVQFTRETGRLVGGSDHLVKAAGRLLQLEKILRTENLSPSDRSLAEYALNRLKELNIK
jgi:RHS repeat-associated protein